MQSRNVMYGNSGTLSTSTKLNATKETNKVPNKVALP